MTQKHTCALVDPDTGEVAHFAHPPNPDEYVEGEQHGNYIVRWGDPFPGANPMQSGMRAHEWYWKNATSEWINKPAWPGDFNTWNVDTKEWDFDSAALYVRVRIDRDLKLTLSDWTQMPDSPLTSAKKAEWSTYRQALRDFPINNANITEYHSISWPTEPTHE